MNENNCNAMKNEKSARRILEIWCKGFVGRDQKVADRWRQRFEKAKSAPTARSIRIEVNWKKSRKYGAFPEATVAVTTSDGGIERFVHEENGHGYDLASSAVQACVRECPSLDRLVIEAGKKAWGLYAVETELFFPHLVIGGKGMDVLGEFFRDIGWNWSEEHGKTWDLYKACDKRR